MPNVWQDHFIDFPVTVFHFISISSAIGFLKFCYFGYWLHWLLRIKRNANAKVCPRPCKLVL